MPLQLTPDDFSYLSLCLEGFFFGLYSGIFALHLQIYASREVADSTKQNIIFHALWVLYVLSAAVIAIDVTTFVVYDINGDVIMAYRLQIAQITTFACCDFIAQLILTHRCWIVWGRNIRVVIIPSILAFTYLVMWIATAGVLFIAQDSNNILITNWGNIVALTGLTASTTVNALVTSLIVFRILKVFREVKRVTTSDEISMGITGGRKLRSIIFIIIESGIALFSIQLIRVVLFLPDSGFSIAATFDTYPFIVSIHEMLNGITPTIILVRVSKGLSFQDEPSLVETVGSLHFAADHPNPNVGMGSLSEDGNLGIEPDDLNELEMINISQERRENDVGSDEIQMVDR